MPFLISKEDNFSYNVLEEGQEVTIELNQEMRIYKMIDVTEGILNIEGTLIIMDV